MLETPAENPAAQPSPEYPGFRNSEVAAAALAAYAADLAHVERDWETLGPPQPATLQALLSITAELMEKGHPPEHAQVEVILFSYFDAVGRIIAAELNIDFDQHQQRCIALAVAEYLETRMKPAEDPNEIFPAAPEDPAIACWEHGAE